MMKTIAQVACAALVTVASGSAQAGEGLLLKPEQIPAGARASLLKDIAAEHAARPEAFAAVRDLRGVRPEFYRKFRNPEPTVVSELRAQGKGALLPMLNELAFDARPPAGLNAKERLALATGMLDAVGVLRDARSGPVLKAVFEGGTKEGALLRASAEALGRLCGAPELATLTQHAAAGDPLREAAIRGLGQCKRVESARELGMILAAASDDATAQQAAGALGLVGSSWAWKAMGPSAEAQGLAVREVAARALAATLPCHEGDVRASILKAMAMVEHPMQEQLVNAARPCKKR